MSSLNMIQLMRKATNSELRTSRNETPGIVFSGPPCSSKHSPRVFKSPNAVQSTCRTRLEMTIVQIRHVKKIFNAHRRDTQTKNNYNKYDCQADDGHVGHCQFAESVSPKKKRRGNELFQKVWARELVKCRSQGRMRGGSSPNSSSPSPSFPSSSFNARR